MSKYPCKYDGCNDQMMIMGYCDIHWQEVKATWTPDQMEQSTPSVTNEAKTK